MRISLEGKWTADIGDDGSYPLQLLGTLDENRIGHRDTGSNQWHPDAALGNENKNFHSDVIATRFTRRFSWRSFQPVPCMGVSPGNAGMPERHLRSKDPG